MAALKYERNQSNRNEIHLTTRCVEDLAHRYITFKIRNVRDRKNIGLIMHINIVFNYLLLVY